MAKGHQQEPLGLETVAGVETLGDKVRVPALRLVAKRGRVNSG